MQPLRHRVPRPFAPVRLLRAVIASSAVAALTLVIAAPPVAAAGAADAQALELVRLMNGERAYRGLAALRVDPFLAGKARDGSIACPNDASKVMAGRAKDMATSGVVSHQLRLCTSYTVLDVLPSWGYNTPRGEVVASNSGYGTAALAYSYGCTNNQTSGCPGSTTYTYYTDARASANFMASDSHRAIVLGSYDRVGCGAWVSTAGGFYYDCIFSQGGPNATVAPPTTAPYSPPATAPPPPPPTPRATAVPPPPATKAPPAATRPPTPVPPAATTTAPPPPTDPPATAASASATPSPTPGEIAAAETHPGASGSPRGLAAATAANDHPAPMEAADARRNSDETQEFVRVLAVLIVAGGLALAVAIAAVRARRGERPGV